MKKQFISFLLLFILIVPAVSTYFWLQQRKRIVKKEIKQEMIAGMDKSVLVFFKFSKVEINLKLHWEHAKEFEYKHEMYDVVERISEKDSVQLWCWYDYKETKLNKQLQQLLDVAFASDTSSKDKKEQIVIFYKSLYFKEISFWKPLISCHPEKTSICFKNDYKSIVISISEPPPETI